MILVGDHLGWAVYGPEGLESPYRYGLGRRLELAPFGVPEGAVISGPKEVIDLLERKLKNG